jgi:hypothetical protein
VSPERIDAFRWVNSRRRSYIPRIPGENLGYFRESHPE